MTYNPEYLDAFKKLMKDPVETKKFLREVHKRPHKSLKGKEKEEMLTILLLMEPVEIDTAGQRFVTQHFDVDGKIYRLTWFDEEEYDIECDCTWEEMGL